MAFPVRVKFRLDDRLRGDMIEWLNAKVGAGRYAIHRVSTRADEAAAIYFRNLAHASQFAAAFPSIRLADDTLAPRALTRACRPLPAGALAPVGVQAALEGEGLGVDVGALQRIGIG